jgi:hypothetical protein
MTKIGRREQDVEVFVVMLEGKALGKSYSEDMG